MLITQLSEKYVELKEIFSEIRRISVSDVTQKAKDNKMIPVKQRV